MTDFEVLILRFDAPLMSFGGVRVDHHNVTEILPGTSLVAGLLGNALGYDHRESDRLQQLQARLRFAARLDRRGEGLVDFQTVDLGQDFLQEGWTTRHRPQRRGKGDANFLPHPHLRHYRADAVCTVVLKLDPPDEAPTLEDLAGALRKPERPLFLGRKCCIPAGPILTGKSSAPSLRRALEAAEPHSRGAEGRVLARWPDEDTPPVEDGRRLPVTDLRDWANQVHTGRRFVREGLIGLREGEGTHDHE